MPVMGFRFKIWQVFGFWISLRAELGIARRKFKRAALQILFLGREQFFFGPQSQKIFRVFPPVA